MLGNLVESSIPPQLGENETLPARESPSSSSSKKSWHTDDLDVSVSRHWQDVKLRKRFGKVHATRKAAISYGKSRFEYLWSINSKKLPQSIESAKVTAQPCGSGWRAVLIVTGQSLKNRRERLAHSRLVEDASGKKRRKTTSLISASKSARRMAILGFEYQLNWYAQTACLRASRAEFAQTASNLLTRAPIGHWATLVPLSSGERKLRTIKPREILTLKSLADDGPDFCAPDSDKLRSLISERGYEVTGRKIQNPGESPVIEIMESLKENEKLEFAQNPHIHHGEMPRVTWRASDKTPQNWRDSWAIEELATILAIRFLRFGRGQDSSELPESAILCADAILRGDAIDRCARDFGVPSETFRRFICSIKNRAKNRLSVRQG